VLQATTTTLIATATRVTAVGRRFLPRMPNVWIGVATPRSVYVGAQRAGWDSNPRPRD
jgi:hypothetical protein